MYVGRLNTGRDHRKAAGERTCNRSAAPTISHASLRVVLIPTAVGCCPSAARRTEAHRRDNSLLRSPLCPAARPVAVSSIPDAPSNMSSIGCIGGDLARPRPGPADRGAAAAVRAAARHRLGHHPGRGRRRRALPPRRRHQDLEPDAAGTPAPTGGVRPAARRAPRPPTNAAVAHAAKHRPDQDDRHLQELRWRTPPSKDPPGACSKSRHPPLTALGRSSAAVVSPAGMESRHPGQGSLPRSRLLRQ
jgi:hypothetical protein